MHSYVTLRVYCNSLILRLHPRSVKIAIGEPKGDLGFVISHLGLSAFVKNDRLSSVFLSKELLYPIANQRRLNDARQQARCHGNLTAFKNIFGNNGHVA